MFPRRGRSVRSALNRVGRAPRRQWLGGAGQQQGAAAGDHQGFSIHLQAILQQGLQAPGTGDPGQGPAGKGQQQLLGAAAQDQLFKVHLPGLLRVLQQQALRAQGGDDAGGAEVAQGPER